jgi:alpha-beta hydrolase superfamily lysophospholipase
MTDYLDFSGPEGLRIRGTVVVVPGRGEAKATYRRFGSRLAADSYRVRVLDEPVPTGTVEQSLTTLGTALEAAVTALEAAPLRPLVLVGTDTAAVALAALVASGSPEVVWWPDGIVLASPPGYGRHDVGSDWESELDARSHCPVHRGVLTDDSAIRRGSLADAVSNELLDLAYTSTSEVPQLWLVGDADPLADREALARAAKALPTARLSVVSGGHHDVLNDLQHRSVAAEVVSFLEVLRSGVPLQSIVTVESGSW